MRPPTEVLDVTITLGRWALDAGDEAVRAAIVAAAIESLFGPRRDSEEAPRRVVIVDPRGEVIARVDVPMDAD